MCLHKQNVWNKNSTWGSLVVFQYCKERLGPLILPTVTGDLVTTFAITRRSEGPSLQIFPYSVYTPCIRANIMKNESVFVQSIKHAELCFIFRLRDLELESSL